MARILIIDAHDERREELRTLLCRAGHDVVTALSGSSVIRGGLDLDTIELVLVGGAGGGEVETLRRIEEDCRTLPVMIFRGPPPSDGGELLLSQISARLLAAAPDLQDPRTSEPL